MKIIRYIVLEILLLIAFAFPLVIELTQMIIGLSIDNMYRNIDIDDVILML